MGSVMGAGDVAGFRPSRVSGVGLRVNDNRRINFTFEVGAVTEQVNVDAELVAVNTASGATSAVLEGREILKIASKGRYCFPFSLTMPRAISTTPGHRRNKNNSVNG